MNVGNKRDVRHSLANLFEGHRSVGIRDREPHYLTAGAHQFLDLMYGSVHIGGVRLSHRLNDARRATTDLQVLDLNWFRLSHNRFAKKSKGTSLCLLPRRNGAPTEGRPNKSVPYF